jgi:hypothetical protein
MMNRMMMAILAVSLTTGGCGQEQNAAGPLGKLTGVPGSGLTDIYIAECPPDSDPCEYCWDGFCEEQWLGSGDGCDCFCGEDPEGNPILDPDCPEKAEEPEPLEAQCGIASGDPDSCLVEVPGAVCANGDPSYYTFKDTEGTNLLIFLQGGGACWTLEGCGGGQASRRTAVHLERQDPVTFIDDGQYAGKAWRSGRLDPDPFAGFDHVVVPYCTGDVHAGSRIHDYAQGPDQGAYPIQHMGYQNLQLILQDLKARFAAPEKILFAGCSAGGIGVYFNLPQLREVYPDASIYVLSDAGTPFKVPHIHAGAFQRLTDTWGAVLPEDFDLGEDRDLDLSDQVRYNANHYPDVRFGLISSYSDFVMTQYARLIGTPYASSPKDAVSRSIISVADEDMGEAHRAFFTESTSHCHSRYDPNSVGERGFTRSGVFDGVSLGDWIRAMISDDNWENSRPDRKWPSE